MTVFLYTLKRLLKNKVILILTLILPLVAIVPSTLSAMHSSGISIGVDDQDSTALTQDLVERLGKNFTVVNMPESRFEDSLHTSEITYAIMIPQNFTENIITGGSPDIQGYGQEEKDCSQIVGAAIDSFIYPSRQIAAQAAGNREAFYKAVSEVPPTEAVEQTKDTKMPYGLIIQFTFMSSIFAATVLIADKENKTFFRSFYSPVSMPGYMFQSILCFLILSLLQMAVLLAVVVYCLGVDPGRNIGTMYLLLSVVGLVSVAFGVAIASSCKSSIQAAGIGLGIIVVMCMFGGAWGMTPTNRIIEGIAKIMPYYWAKDAADKLVSGQSFSTIGGNILLLLGFAIVFFLAGTWRKSDIER